MQPPDDLQLGDEAAWVRIDSPEQLRQVQLKERARAHRELDEALDENWASIVGSVHPEFWTYPLVVQTQMLAHVRGTHDRQRAEAHQALDARLDAGEALHERDSQQRPQH